MGEDILCSSERNHAELFFFHLYIFKLVIARKS